MPPADDVSLMARYFKLLGDRGRLAIVGLLAARPRTLEELQAELPSTSRSILSRNLKLLEESDWITPQEDGCYQLRAETLTILRAALARVETSLPTQPDSTLLEKALAQPTEGRNAFIKVYFDDKGHLRRIPDQRQHREMVLRHVGEQHFTIGRAYDEQEVDELLSTLFGDARALRQALVEEGVLESRAGVYWFSLRKKRK